MPEENTFEDDEIRLRVYRQTIVVMYYIHIVDYVRIGILIVQWFAIHFYFTRKARRERLRIESQDNIEERLLQLHQQDDDDD